MHLKFKILIKNIRISLFNLISMINLMMLSGKVYKRFQLIKKIYLRIINKLSLYKLEMEYNSLSLAEKIAYFLYLNHKYH